MLWGSGVDIASIVAMNLVELLENERSLVPFHKSDIKFIAVIGSDAYPAVLVGGGRARLLSQEIFWIMEASWRRR
jgi:hypothetical protein